MKLAGNRVAAFTPQTPMDGRESPSSMTRLPTGDVAPPAFADNLSAAALKAQYLTCLGALGMTGVTLRQIAQRLTHLGISRATLVSWGVDFGYSRSYMRSLLSRLLCASGQRRRKTRAGRRTSQAVLALLALVTSPSHFALLSVFGSRSSDLPAPPHRKSPFV